MAALVIKDSIEVLGGGQGPCQLARTYTLIGVAGEEITIEDFLLVPEAKVQNKDSGLIINERSLPTVQAKMLNFQGGEKEVLSITASFSLASTIPVLTIKNRVFNTLLDLPTSYSCEIHIPFDISGWQVITSFRPSYPEVSISTSNRQIRIPAFTLTTSDHHFEFTISIRSTRPLPVLDALSTRYSEHFNGIHVVSVLHLLGDFPYFAKSLVRAGATQGRIYIVGIPYSSKTDVVQLLKEDGFLEVHIPQEYPFEKEINKALSWILSEYKMSKERANPFKWMIIEDGGYIVPALHSIASSDPIWGEIIDCCLGAVEQTRNGIWSYQDQVEWFSRRIPVCSVAEAQLKLDLESGWIGQAVYNNIMQLLGHADFFPKEGDKALVIGMGATGRPIAKVLGQNGWDVKGYDKSSVARAIARHEGISIINGTSPKELLKDVRLVIGATGKENVLGAEYIAEMRDGTVIVNASSKRREVDWNALTVVEPQQIGSAMVYDFPDRYGKGRQIYVLAEGFPVNFYTKQSVIAANIELIMACIFRAAVEIVVDSRRPDPEKLFRISPPPRKKKKKGLSEKEIRRAIFSFPPSLEEEVAEIWLRT